MTFGRFNALAIFELGEPFVGLFACQMKSCGPIVVPSGKGVAEQLLASTHSLVRTLAHKGKPQSMRGVPRRSTSPVTPKMPISANARTK